MLHYNTRHDLGYCSGDHCQRATDRSLVRMAWKGGREGEGVGRGFVVSFPCITKIVNPDVKYLNGYGRASVRCNLITFSSQENPSMALSQVGAEKVGRQEESQTSSNDLFVCRKGPISSNTWSWCPYSDVVRLYDEVTNGCRETN